MRAWDGYILLIVGEMKKLATFCTVILPIILVAATIFSSGCSCFVSSPQPYGPRVTGDGTGGAIAVYEDIKGGNQHDFYAQKISPEGDILWGEKGVLIGGGYKQFDSFHELHLVSDGSGGAVIAWSAYPSEPDWRLAPGQRQIEYLTHITRVDSDGSIMWQREVRGVDHMISDGAGGAIIATDYSYDERTLFVIKIDPEGNFPWGEDGVLIVSHNIYQSNSLGLAGDGAGGAIIVWNELFREPGTETHQPKITNHIFAQRIDAQGQLPWGQDGVLLHITPEEVRAEELRVTSDGSGGAIAVWMQVPEGKVEEGSPKALLWDICAQRVGAKGEVLWAENGVPLDITKEGGVCPTNRLVISDGASGAIVIWEDLRKGLMSIYAQKIDADGSIKWQPGGEEVCFIETSLSFWPRTAVSDGSGGAIVTFWTRAQKIDADGRTMWPDDGILFTERGTHALAYDGHGGAVIAWGIGKDMFSSEKSYVQRISADGKLLWGDKGIRLNP